MIPINPLEELYRLLVQPLHDALNTLPENSSLIIVCQDKLAKVSLFSVKKIALLLSFTFSLPSDRLHIRICTAYPIEDLENTVSHFQSVMNKNFRLVASAFS